MIARTQGWASTTLMVLAAIAVIGGLAISGGPAEGKRERRDATRLDDLRLLTTRVQCLAEDTNRLPERIGSSELCAGEMRLNDPFTDAPYRFEPIDERSYRVCADFERPDQVGDWRGEEFDAGHGCLTGRVTLLAPPVPPDANATPPGASAPSPLP